MDMKPYPWFTIPCQKVFQPLVTCHGFSGPSVKQYAHEIYVEYATTDRWISIEYEIGQYPLIELFQPTREIKSRRIPLLKVPTEDLTTLNAFNKKYHKLCRAQKYAEADSLARESISQAEQDLETYMIRQFDALIQQEADFIVRR
ncbi:MAG TPA: hypothetical protein VI298_02440 [Geobacteraceae bacterium]